MILEAVIYTGHNDFDIQQWSKGQCIPSPVLEPTEDNPTGSYLQVDGYTAGVGDVVLKMWDGKFVVLKGLK